MSERFLDSLTEEDVSHLRRREVVRRFPRGTALFQELQVSDRVMLLTEGRVKFASIAEEGRESVLAFRGPGEVLGELSAIDGRPRSAGVTAVDSVQALVIPSADFRAFLERSPRAALWIPTRLIARLREADRKRAEFGVSDTIGRVAAQLGRAGREQPARASPGRHPDRPADQGGAGQLGRLIARGRQKALHTLCGLRWVGTERRSITVLDMDALKNRAG